jgi:hypothetical protein
MVADPWSGNRRESNRDNVLDRKPDSLFRGVKVSSAIVKDTDLGLFVTLAHMEQEEICAQPLQEMRGGRAMP